MKHLSTSMYWALQSAGWGCFVLITTSIAWMYNSFDREKDLLLFAGRLVVFVILGLIISHLMRIVVVRFKFLQKPFNKQLAWLLLLVISASVIFALINILLLNAFDLLKPAEAQFISTKPVLLVLANSFSTFMYLLIWMLFYVIFHFVPEYRVQLKNQGS